jgi:hypothetical protein
MLLAGKRLFVAGPPYMLDEEAAYRKPHDPAVRARLSEQDALYAGKKGAQLIAVAIKNGKRVGEVHLDALPVWDGMASARGRRYLATADGKVTCWSGREPKSP